MSPVVVLGLGTAGAAVAALCAERGIEVLGLERGPLDRAGARWTNGVPAWAFDQAGLPRPVGAELHAQGAPFHMLAGRGPTHVRIAHHDLLEVDMPALGARLRDKASASGATLIGDARAQVRGQRVRWNGEEVQARLVVDATGLGGLGLLGRAAGPLCVAAQEQREVVDAQAARAFFERHGVPEGETLCWTGIAGGYSIVNLQLHGQRLAILTGAIPALGHPSGPQLLAQFVAEHPWVGPKVAGGSRALPLGPPLDCVGRAGQVAIGDAAGMVFSAHGSGIAQQLLAARLLADVLVGGGDAWDFNVAWQRQRAGALCGMVVFRSFSQSLSPAELERLMALGVMGPKLSAQTLTQRDPLPALGEGLRAAKGLLQSPKIARRMVPALARMQALALHHRRYPKDPSKLARWSARRSELLSL